MVVCHLCPLGGQGTRLRSKTFSLGEQWEVVLAPWNFFHLISQLRMPRLRAVILPILAEAQPRHSKSGLSPAQRHMLG